MIFEKGLVPVARTSPVHTIEIDGDVFYTAGGALVLRGLCWERLGEINNAQRERVIRLILKEVGI